MPAIIGILTTNLQRLTCLMALCLLAAIIPASAAKGAKPGVTYRVRVMRISPEQPVMIGWRYGGEGLGGSPVNGNVTREYLVVPTEPTGENDAKVLADGVTLGVPPPDTHTELTEQGRTVVKYETYSDVYLSPGFWSREVPISSFGGHRGNLSLTFGLTGLKSNVYVTNTELEFEFLYNGEPLKRFRVDGAQGNALGVMIPFHRLNPDGSPKPEFAREVGSLLEYVRRKYEVLKQAPGMEKPVPKLYAISTDCYGFGSGGYAVRTSDPATFEMEFQILRLMGMNATVNIPSYFAEKRTKKEGIWAEFNRLQQGGYGGSLVPTVGSVFYAPGIKKPAPKPGDGCPYYPATVRRMEGPEIQQQVDASLATASKWGVDQIWPRSVDEIGSIFDGAPEGKAHMGSCPYCRKAFHAFVRADGRTLADFGATSWDEIRPTYGYWSNTYWESLEELRAARDNAQKEFNEMNDVKLDQGTALLDHKAPSLEDEDSAARDVISLDTRSVFEAKSQALHVAEKRLNALEWGGPVLEVEPTKRESHLTAAGWNLLGYYSARFNNESTARCLEPLRKAYEVANERKRQALERGETDTPVAKQPWGYSFALRANTFLMSGHSLDFFDYYRHADNAIVYETSNRDWRVWQWDSYLCEVGHSLSQYMNKQFGIYVKPHRGAPIQRILTAVAHGARMVYYYTYGPEYVKGDSFGGNVDLIKQIARASRLVAGGEAVTYDADRALPTEVAVVRPLTSDYMSGSASYENAKWIYTALMHAHIPMDALDEGLLMSENLSRYKVIVISGSHIRRDVAMKLAKWVEDGGTLVTSGWGMARDEANRPLDDILLPVFGLKTRGEMDAWGSVPGYGATRLGAVQQMRQPPKDATVRGKEPLKGSFMPVVGREVLQPMRDDDVMAAYADGGAAVIHHRYGKGTAWLIGTYAGVEYAWEAMTTTDKDQKWFRADKRSWIAGPVLDAGVRPVVDAEGFYNLWEDAALVEGHLLRNRQTGALAVILINWNHHISKAVKVKIRAAGNMATAHSVALEQTFPLERKDGLLVVTLPKLDEGDVLLLSP